MKISRLRASNVHGYLPIAVKFFEDLTFLTGLNGSGKTSALRLLMALLTPNIEELGSIDFSEASIDVKDGDQNITVSATRDSDRIIVSISTQASSLIISTAEIQLLMDVRRREEPRAPILEKYSSDPVVTAIKAISTPMFLGLDRRFFSPSGFGEDPTEARRREMLSRRLWSEDPNVRESGVRSLMEANYLVFSKLQEVRAKQESLDDTLRTQFYSKAFEYKPVDILGQKARLPSKNELDAYRKQMEKIERAAEGYKIPVPEIQSALTHFFSRMSDVVTSMDKAPRPVDKRHGKKISNKDTFLVPPDKNYIEWIINRPQVDRILEHLKLLEEYIERRDALRDPINRFLTLVNSFLAQTDKVVSVSDSGQLEVSPRGGRGKPISALSSGERQLLVMLAHLSLNPSLAHSGVFIVDEPELSLHIDWQEKFVDAIQEANPKVQIILATHSPAIVLDRIDSCRALNEAEDA